METGASHGEEHAGMKWFWTIGCFAVMVVQYLIYQSIKWSSGEHKWQESFFKGAATAMSALLAGYGYFSSPDVHRLLILTGLCVCVAADVILDKSFLLGTAAFGLGHICYGASMLLSQTPGWANLIVFLSLAAGVMALYPQMKKLANGQSALPYLGYALLIVAMLSLAITQKPLMMAGALLFVVSDCMLLFLIVKKNRSKKYDYLCLGCYFLAQFLIAASTVF